MAQASKIEWTETTWNPLAGCTPISPGCTNCYAATMARRLEAMGQSKYAGTAERRGSVDVFTGKINLGDETDLAAPLKWKKPRMVFVNSMSDLFHEAVPDDFIDRVFAVMALCGRHTFQVLTKRPERAATYLKGLGQSFKRLQGACPVGWSLEWQDIPLVPFPLPNVWIGTSCEDQKRADERIPHLLQCAAKVRFLSCEPLLGPIDLRTGIYSDVFSNGKKCTGFGPMHGTSLEGISWVITGGESGPHARPMHPQWARDIRDQCQASGVAFFFKQWGRWAPFVNEAHFTHCGAEKHAHLWLDSDGVRSGHCWIIDDDGSWSNWTGEPPVDEDNNLIESVAVMGEFTKKAAGRILDGREWSEMPT